jgi:formate dehydrogenase major subunit
MVTERVDAETVFLPFHFSGRWGGVDLAPYYPQGAKPVVRAQTTHALNHCGLDAILNCFEDSYGAPVSAP